MKNNLSLFDPEEPDDISPVVITPHNYQEDAISAVLSGYQRGCMQQVISLFVGGGKTTIGAALIPRLVPGDPNRTQTLWIAHREELLDQAAERIRMMNPGMRVEIEQGSRHASAEADVIVASVQSIGRTPKGLEDEVRRIAKISPDKIKLCITDEVHHAVNTTYLNAYEYLGCLGDDSPILLLGITATPKRADKIALGNVFKEIVYHKGILDGIKEHWLCDIEAHLIQSDVNLDGIATRAGDFAEDQLVEAINIEKRNRLILSAWEEFAKGTRQATLVFCANVQHMRDVHQLFVDSGVEARYVYGETPKDVRRKLISDFRAGEIPVLLNVGVATEGLDCPITDCLIMARPTKSQPLYQQILGRGLRTYPGKENCLLLDVVDVARKHSLVTLPTLFGLPFNFEDNSEEKSFKKTFEQIEEMIDANPRVAQAKSFTEAIKIVSEKIDILRIGEIPDLKEMSHLNWYQTGESNMTLRVPEAGHVQIQEDFIGRFEAKMVNLKGEVKHEIGSFASMKTAIGAADHYVRSHFQQAMALLSTSLPWYKQPATDKQKGFLQKLGMRQGKDFKPDISKGDANHLITLRQEQLNKWKGKAAFRSRLKVHDVKVGKISS